MVRKAFLFAILYSCGAAVFGQNRLSVHVSDSESKEGLEGVKVLIRSLNVGALTDEEGKCSLDNLAPGKYEVEFFLTEYQEKEQEVSIPYEGTLEIALSPVAAEEEAVTITSTRTNSRIGDMPTKVEVLGEEEMGEENGIKPGNVASILGDLSVIHIQQTSAVTGNSVVRMQGLDGKYTQLLRDGLPVYDGVSGSFGILQLPPLDLKQVEIIKGPVSTLYGGGAIAGLVNFISKEPADTSEVSVTLNRSSLKETNINGFLSKRWSKVGMTFFAGETLQDAVDLNGDGFSDVAMSKTAVLHPRFFFYPSSKLSLRAGWNAMFEDRMGGDMRAIQFKPDTLHAYYQRHNSNRDFGDYQALYTPNATHSFTVKGTVGLYKRSSDFAGSVFAGRQISTYNEASWLMKKTHHDLVTGFTNVTESYVNQYTDSTAVSDYLYQTAGAFVQETWKPKKEIQVEAGFRLDRHNRYGWFALPRLALLIRPLDKLSMRVSAGQGYKTPSVFTQQTTSSNLRFLLPPAPSVNPERSTGANCDIYYHTTLFGEVAMQLNQAFYYTIISAPLVLSTDSLGYMTLQNGTFHTSSLGTDTYLRFSWRDLEMYFGYNHTIAKQKGNGVDRFVTFAPQDKFSTTIAYEIEGKWRFGIEASWVGNQYIDYDRNKGRNYWFWAAMIERKIGPLSIVLNGENLLDVRQSRWSSLYSGTISNPVFSNLYAPIDGRIINLSARLRL